MSAQPAWDPFGGRPLNADPLAQWREYGEQQRRQDGRMVKCAHCGSMHEVFVPPFREPIETEALRWLADDLDGINEDGWRFFRALWSKSPGYHTVRELAVDLCVDHSTLRSRFIRAGLPAVKDYLLEAMLVRAAREFERRGATGVSVAYAMDASSPQSFGRIVKERTGLTLNQWRERETGASRLNHFRAELILPYRDTLRDFAPLLGIASPRYVKKATR